MWCLFSNVMYLFCHSCNNGAYLFWLVLDHCVCRVGVLPICLVYIWLDVESLKRKCYTMRLTLVCGGYVTGSKQIYWHYMPLFNLSKLHWSDWFPNAFKLILDCFRKPTGALDKSWGYIIFWKPLDLSVLGCLQELINGITSKTRD